MIYIQITSSQSAGDEYRRLKETLEVTLNDSNLDWLVKASVSAKELI